jgi:hypothetical protein
MPSSTLTPRAPGGLRGATLEPLATRARHRRIAPNGTINLIGSAGQVRASCGVVIFVFAVAACRDTPPKTAGVAHDTVPAAVAPAEPASGAARAADSGAGAGPEGPGGLGSRHALVLGRGSTADTIRDLWVSDTPSVQGDSVQFGLAYDGAGKPKELYRYGLRRRHLEQAAVPADLRPALSDFALSPDGHHLAYVRFSSDQMGQGVVRRWPSGEVVLETASIRVPISDAMTGAAAWSEGGRFEFFIMPDSSDGSHWVRFRGTVASGVASIDTVIPSR